MQDHPLLSTIRQCIEASGGRISFEQFMRAALYEPGLGYYETAKVFGSEGDFITAADLGPWLAKGFVDLIVWGWQAMGQPLKWNLLEQGGGSGELLRNVLQELANRGVRAPARIIAVETSARMRQRQLEIYREEMIQVEQFTSLNEVVSIDPCIMFCNELPDAFPVRCVVKKQEKLYERGVGWDGSAFVWLDYPNPLDSLPWIDSTLQNSWPNGYVTEYNPHLNAWQRNIASAIRHGFVFTVDYGFTQREYYRSNRVGGTLLAHYRHQANAEVLISPGSRDITAHVDFTALASWGSNYGLHPTGFMSQGAWLAQSPLVQAHIVELAGSTEPEAMKQMASIKRLLLPTGMGESFKLLIQRTDNLGDEAKFPSYLESFDHLRDLVTSPVST